MLQCTDQYNHFSYHKSAQLAVPAVSILVAPRSCRRRESLRRIIWTISLLYSRVVARVSSAQSCHFYQLFFIILSSFISPFCCYCRFAPPRPTHLPTLVSREVNNINDILALERFSSSSKRWDIMSLSPIFHHHFILISKWFRDYWVRHLPALSIQEQEFLLLVHFLLHPFLHSEVIVKKLLQ